MENFLYCRILLLDKRKCYVKNSLDAAGKAAAPSLVTHHMFMGTLVLNHPETTCFWVRLSYIAQELPSCDLYSALTEGQG